MFFVDTSKCLETDGENTYSGIYTLILTQGYDSGEGETDEKKQLYARNKELYALNTGDYTMKINTEGNAIMGVFHGESNSGQDSNSSDNNQAQLFSCPAVSTLENPCLMVNKAKKPSSVGYLVWKGNLGPQSLSSPAPVGGAPAAGGAPVAGGTPVPASPAAPANTGEVSNVVGVSGIKVLLEVQAEETTNNSEKFKPAGLAQLFNASDQSQLSEGQIQTTTGPCDNFNNGTNFIPKNNEGCYKFTNLKQGVYRLKYVIPTDNSAANSKFKDYNFIGALSNDNNIYSIVPAPKSAKINLLTEGYNILQSPQAKARKVVYSLPFFLEPDEQSTELNVGIQSLTPGIRLGVVNTAVTPSQAPVTNSDLVMGADFTLEKQCKQPSGGFGPCPTPAPTGVGEMVNPQLMPTTGALSLTKWDCAGTNQASGPSAHSEFHPSPTSPLQTSVWDIPQLVGFKCQGLPSSAKAGRFYSRVLPLPDAGQSAYYQLTQTMASPGRQLLVEPILVQVSMPPSGGQPELNIIKGGSDSIKLRYAPVQSPEIQEVPSTVASNRTAKVRAVALRAFSQPTTNLMPTIYITDTEVGQLPATGGRGLLEGLGIGAVLTLFGAMYLRKNKTGEV